MHDRCLTYKNKTNNSNVNYSIETLSPSNNWKQEEKTPISYGLDIVNTLASGGYGMYSVYS